MLFIGTQFSNLQIVCVCARAHTRARAHARACMFVFVFVCARVSNEPQDMLVGTYVLGSVWGAGHPVIACHTYVYY